MNVERSDMERIARYCNRARVRTLKLWAKLSKIKQPDLAAAAFDLHRESASVLVGLRNVYDVNPNDALPDMPNVPLALLDTPANRKLARLLREAREAAIEVDKERGWYPDGTADLIGDLATQVEQECFGPTGFDTR